MNTNKISTREYWLDRIDDTFEPQEQDLHRKVGKQIGADGLRESAIHSLGLKSLLNRRNTAQKRIEKARMPEIPGPVNLPLEFGDVSVIQLFTQHRLQDAALRVRSVFCKERHLGWRLA